MKKAISILAIAAMIMSMTACGDAKTSSDSPDSEETSLDSDLTDDTSDSDSSDDSEDSGESTDNSSDETSDENPSGNNNANGHEGEMSGSVFVLDDGRALSLYGGGYERGKNYAQSLNQLKELVGDQVNVFSLVAPTAVSFYLPEKYSGYSGSEWDNIENINYYLDGIIPVDAYTALSQHVDEDIYFRTDHHWSPLGAYYAAKEFAETAQVPFVPLSDYETVSRDGYIGTMYGYSEGDVRIKNNPEAFTYYKPKNDYTVTYYTQSLTDPYESGLFLKSLDSVAVVSWYLVFMGGDSEAAHIHTDVANGRKLVVVKDSYGNSLVPCLTNSFEDIWVVDMRYFEKSVSQLVKDEGLTDVLFCMNSFSATGDNQYNLANIL